MMRRVALLAVLACAPVPAFAQAELMMFGLCKKIPDEAARLKCFDAIGSVTEPAKADLAPIKTAPQWEITESKSPVDDTPQAVAALYSDDAESSLVIRCQERKTEVIIMPKDLFAYERGSVTLRLNDLPATTASWSASSNNRALFAPNPVAFAKMLPDNGKLFVRTMGHSRRGQDATFLLGNVSAARDKISVACKWQEAKPIAASPQPKATQKSVSGPIGLSPKQ